MSAANLSVVEGVRNQFIAAVIANIMIFNQGSVVAWVSPSLPILSSEDSPLGAPLTFLQTSLIASSFCIGAIVGTPLFGWIVETFGRRKAILATAVPFLICWGLKIFWLDPYVMIFSRFIVGIGSGGGLLVTPMYCIEIANVNTRGTLGSFLTFAFNLGVVFVYILGAYLGYFVVLVIMLSIPIAFIFLMLRMPESPSDLVKMGKFTEAGEALAWLRSVPAESTVVKNELDKLIAESKSSPKGIDSIEASLRSSSENRQKVSAFKFLWRSKPSRRALLLIISLLTAQSFLGIFAVLSYASTIFEEAGSTLAPATSSIIVGVIQMVGSVLASSLIDRLGRKILFVSACSCVVLSMASLGTYFYMRDSGYDVSAFWWLPVLSLSIAVCTYSMGPGPVPFILASEVFMVQVRGLAVSISITWLWTMTFFTVQFFGPVVALFGSHVVFWTFATIGCVGIFICIVFQPETKGVPIEKTVAYFGGKTKTIPNADANSRTSINSDKTTRY